MNTFIVTAVSILLLALFAAIAIAVVSEIMGLPRRSGGDSDATLGAVASGADGGHGLAAGGDCGGGDAGDVGGHC